MTYDDLWKVEAVTVQPARLPRRVKDWPEDARREFKRVKNELWKWHKKQGKGSGSGLALWAYEAVKQTWESDDETLEDRRRRQTNEFFEKMETFANNPTNRTLRAANGTRLE